MAARFTEHAGDPQWLRSQREAQARHRPKTGPHVPLVLPKPRFGTVSEPDPQQFVQGAKSNSGVAFVLGAIVGAVVTRGRR